MDPIENSHKNPLNEDPRSNKEARARRLESLRGLTRLSRNEFAQKCGVKSGSFQNWETPRFGGLTEKAAKKIVRGVKTLGIVCSLEWLMYGIGPGPQTDERLYMGDALTTVKELQKTYLTNDEEIQHISEELLFFRQHYPDAIDHVINDDGMEPYYKVGEYVSGRTYYHNDIEKTIGMDCIVKTADGETFLRHIRKGSIEERYTLTCINPFTSVEKPVLYDMELISSAPVVWIRRRYSKTSS